MVKNLETSNELIMRKSGILLQGNGMWREQEVGGHTADLFFWGSLNLLYVFF